MNIDDLRRICSTNGLELTDEMISQLERYATVLAEWNAKINLISRKDEANILERHVLHSLTLRVPSLTTIQNVPLRVADIGTGGGLPGIPFRIVTAEADVTLIDSIQKKITACNDMITSLGLTKRLGVVGRAEELAKRPEFARGFDAIISRAVAPLDELLGWTAGLMKPGASLYSLKGGDLSQEIERTRKRKNVAEVTELPLDLLGYDGFVREEKKIVRVRMTS